jgi:broad specificity phosphatase PhoE
VASVAGMEIILIRHGQPAWSDGTVAFNDPGLTDLGHAQAQRMAERVADMGAVDHFLVSPMVRARETARPLAERLGQEPLSLPWLREIGLPPDWDGAPIDRIATAFRESRRRDREEWWEPVAPGAEPFGQFHRRVVRGLDTYLARLRVEPHRRDPEAVWHIPEDAGRLVIVAHAGTNSAILGRLLGIEPRPWEWERFHSVHASVTILSTTEIGPGWIFALDRFSGTGHLAGLDITH